MAFVLALPHMHTSLIVTLLLGFSLTWAVCTLRTNTTTVKRLRGPRADSWLLGSLVHYYGGGKFVSLDLQKKFGYIVRFKGFLYADRLQVTDPLAIQHIFNATAYLWERETVRQPRMKILFGEGLLSVQKGHHRRLRRVMMPPFNSTQVAAVHPYFSDASNELKDIWEAKIAESPDKKITVTSKADVLMATLNAIGNAAFGYEFDAFNKGLSDPLLRAFATLDSIVGERTYYQILLEHIADSLPISIVNKFYDLPLVQGQSLRPQLEVMHNTSRELFKSGLALAQDTEEYTSRSKKNLLSVLIKANLSESEATRMSDREVTDQLMTFIFAGWSAMSSVLAWTFEYIADKPEVQAKLRKEFAELGDDPDSLGRARYAEAVLQETLRMAHFAPLERFATQDDVIPLENPTVLENGKTVSEVPVAKGTRVSVPLVALNQNESRFGKDFTEYDPDRWMTPEGEKERSYRGLGAGTWNGMLSFGSGPRGCIGVRFANLQMKTTLRTLMTSFEISPGKDKPDDVVISLAPTE